MSRVRIVINGYPVPWGKSGVAVTKACEIVLAEPGVAQAELMNRATEFANISNTNSSWIVSPGEHSPALLLWDRKRIGRKYHCYPNEFTSALGGASEARANEWLRANKGIVRGDQVPRKGDLVEVKNMRIFSPWSQFSGKALFLGWSNGSSETVTETLEEYGEKFEYRCGTVPLLMMEGRVLPMHKGKVKVIK
jgi:hypothetical protein